jgi:hypothetical protein
MIDRRLERTFKRRKKKFSGVRPALASGAPGIARLDAHHRNPQFVG